MIVRSLWRCAEVFGRRKLRVEKLSCLRSGDRLAWFCVLCELEIARLREVYCLLAKQKQNSKNNQKTGQRVARCVACKCEEGEDEEGSPRARKALRLESSSASMPKSFA